MLTKNLYHSRIPSCKFIFKSGKEANFIGGTYLTSDPVEIAELDIEIKSVHPHIYVDENNLAVDTENIDPLHEIKRKAVEEYLAAQQAASDPNSDKGVTEQNTKVGNVANSVSITGTASVSTLVLKAGS